MEHRVIWANLYNFKFEPKGVDEFNFKGALDEQSVSTYGPQSSGESITDSDLDLNVHWLYLLLKIVIQK